MPYIFSSIWASFEEYINKIFAKKSDIFAIVYLDNILIYPEDYGKSYMNTVYWVVKQQRKHGLFNNLKKCRFYHNEICFLKFAVSVQDISMKEERIETIKTLWKY